MLSTGSPALVRPIEPGNLLPAETTATMGASHHELEIAHVLFLDIVGYSKLSMTAQAQAQRELKTLTQSTKAVRRAQRRGQVICRPTGDGMALLFFADLLAPVRCALEMTYALAERAQNVLTPEAAAPRKPAMGAFSLRKVAPAQTPIALRMGIHTGAVLRTVDVNAQVDVAGDGVNLAQRVMDCGDGGHILVSDAMASTLRSVEPWNRYLHDLGICRVKHDVSVHLFNFYGRIPGHAPFGSAIQPRKVASERANEWKRTRETAAQQTIPSPEEDPFPYLHLLMVLVVVGAVVGLLVFAFARLKG